MPANLLLLAAAIAAVETGLSPQEIGAAGERGPHQFTRATWEETVPGVDFVLALDPDISERVAALRLQYLQEHRGTTTVFALAQQWNPRAPKSYAVRVLNLYLDKSFRPDLRRPPTIQIPRSPDMLHDPGFTRSFEK